MVTTSRTRMPARRFSLRSAVLLLALAGVAACNDDSSPVSTERPLTVDEAALLASLQFDNYDDGGADFQVATAFLATNDTLNLQGVVDWENHIGYAVATGKGAESGITEVYWTRTAVLERRPAADTVLAGMGYEEVKFFARTPEPEKRLLDKALAIIMSLASSQRDNPQLIQQKEGSSFLRLDTLRNRPSTVLRYGERNIYWLDTETNRLLRFEGNAAAGGAPTVVDILDRGTRTVPLPREGQVIAAETVAELYQALQSSASTGQPTRSTAP